MPGMGRWMGPWALCKEREVAARRKLYNKDAEGPGDCDVMSHNWEGGRREGAT